VKRVLKTNAIDHGINWKSTNRAASARRNESLSARWRLRTTLRIAEDWRRSTRPARLEIRRVPGVSPGCIRWSEPRTGAAEHGRQNE
jgi:hypothetical protein